MHIVFVGLPGVPYRGRACDVRLTYLANLLAQDNEVTIVNWYSPKSFNKNGRGELVDKVKIYDLIGSKNTKGLKSKLLSVCSIVKEPFSLLNLNRKKHIDVIHVYTERVFVYMVYAFVAKLIGAKMIYNYVEDRSTFNNFNWLKKKLQGFADWTAAKCADGVIPISDYLQRKAQSINKDINSLKIPPICDFSSFKRMPIKDNIGGKYLLYCGSTSYLDVAEFIIQAFNASKISASRKLVMVLSGSEEKRKYIREKYPNVSILCNLEYIDLISSFSFAEALFIPLRNIPSEIARFPNKVCEYLAAGGVIISTKVGEIDNYFSNYENGIICKDYSLEEMRIRLDDLADGNIDIDKLKEESYKVGLQNFDLYAYRDKINEFLKSL